VINQVSVFWFDMGWVINLPWFEFESRKFWWFYHYPIILCGESYLLVSWCACDIYDMVGSDEDRGRSRRPSVKNQRWSSTSWVLGDRMIDRSDDVVCGPHRVWGDDEHEFLCLASKPRSTFCQWFGKKTTRMSFLVWPQNQGRRFVSGLASKSLGRVLPIWPQNRLLRVSRFGPQNCQIQFGDLGLKITATVFGLDLKTKPATICQLCHKIDGRMETVWDARRDLAAWFIWKQIRLRFSSLTSRLVEAWRRWCMWHHHGGRVEFKLKTNMSIWWTASDPATLILSFSLY
jgi:hypothetical protein